MQIERRSSPRHPLRFPLTVCIGESEQETEFEAESLNISNTSIEISCNNLLVDALLAQDSYPHTCELKFILPEEVHEFALLAQVVTHRRLSQHQFYLVLTLDGQAKESIVILSKYLKELKPNNLLRARSSV